MPPNVRNRIASTQPAAGGATVATWEIKDPALPAPLPEFNESGVPLAYLHHGGHHWVFDQVNPTGPWGNTDPFTITWPGGTEFATGVVKRISDDGATIETYEIPLDYTYAWDFGILGITIDLCTFDTQVARQSWANNAIDACFASDGTNLWLGLICQEDLPYPWYKQKYDVGFLDPDTLEATSAASLYHRYVGSFLCSGDGVNPFDDLGGAASQRFSSMKLVVFVWNGAGFTRIGDTEPAFINQSDHFCAVSGVSLAASPAEPGVCHAMWAESGVWGQRDPGPGGDPGFSWPNRGSRLVYSKWDAGALLEEHDVLRYDQIYDLTPYPPPPRPDVRTWVGRRWNYADGTWDPDHYGAGVDETTWAFTPNFVLKNDHGWPVCFISRSVIDDLGATPPHHAPNGTEATIRMWDLRAITTNFPNELQAITPDLLPQPTETMFSASTPAGITPDRIPGLSVNTGPNRRTFGVSNLYADELLGGADVYLLNVGFALAAAGSSPTCQGFYRVPADGSGAFSVMDGKREIAILPNATHPGGIGATYVPLWDFYSDASDVWVPAAAGSNRILHLDRACALDWVVEVMEADPDVAGIFMPSSMSANDIGNGAPYLDASDVLHWAVFVEDFAADFRSGISRSVIVSEPCVPRDIHIWDRITFVP